MAKKASPHRRLIISKNLILMLVMLAIIALSSVAWFTVHSNVSADGISIKASDSKDIQLALPKRVGNKDYFPKSNDDWEYEIQFENSGYLKDLVKDVTSDGQNFIIPGFDASASYQKGRKVNVADMWTTALSSKEALTDEKPNNDDQYQYVSLDFYVRSTVDTISIMPDSYLAAGCELGIYLDPATGRFAGGYQSDKRLLTGNNTYRVSSYSSGVGTAGAFSADALVGAMRVSIVGAPVDGIEQTDGNYTEVTYYGGEENWSEAAQNKLLWLPRPDVHLNTFSEGTPWTLTTGIHPSHTLATETYGHTFYEGNILTGNVKKTVTEKKYSDPGVLSINGTETNHPEFKVSKISNDDNNLGTLGYYPKFGQSAVIMSPEDAAASGNTIVFDQGTGEKASFATTGYYVYKCTLNIWIEGEDTEARRAMNEGLFSLSMEFG